MERRGWLLELPPHAVEDCGPHVAPRHRDATSARREEEGTSGGRTPLAEIRGSFCNNFDRGGPRGIRECGLSKEGRGKRGVEGVVPLGGRRLQKKGWKIFSRDGGAEDGKQGGEIENVVNAR